MCAGNMRSGVLYRGFRLLTLGDSGQQAAAGGAGARSRHKWSRQVFELLNWLDLTNKGWACTGCEVEDCPAKAIIP